ncbi:MAG: amidohydrolase family protein [Sphingosinicella sp.]|uniref:amidohydrolase family protein n=1 Tax=Sphingosinicella sp. TaxID=1917971 RepID=UPI0040377377
MRLSALLAASLALFAQPPAAAQTAPPVMAFENVTLIDGTGSAPQPGRTVVVRGDRIADIFETGARELPQGTLARDFSGHTLMPGLIDGHVHMIPAADRESRLRALLHSGVTSVRELVSDTRISSELARRAASGEIESPAIYYSALFGGGGAGEDPRSQRSQRGMEPGTAPWSRRVTAGDDIVRVVSEARATGATGVKLYGSLDADLVAALTEEAHRQGLLVWAHTAIFPARAGDAVRAGADSIIHAKGLITEGRTDVPDTFAEGTGVWLPARDFAGTDPEAPPFPELYREMVRRGTILEPAHMADGDLARQPLPEWRAAMREWACRATGAAHRAGVTISAGTDTALRAGALHRELARLVECGLSPLDAIRAATLNNARALGIEETHGTVEVGKIADLVLVAGNPAERIGDSANVRAVIRSGRVIEVPAEAR